MKFAVVVAVCLLACGVSAQPPQDATTTAPKGSAASAWEKFVEIFHWSKKPTTASPLSPGKREVNEPAGRCTFMSNNNADQKVSWDLLFQCFNEIFGAFNMPVPAMGKREVTTDTDSDDTFVRECGRPVNGKKPSPSVMFQCLWQKFGSSFAMPVPAGK